MSDEEIIELAEEASEQGQATDEDSGHEGNVHNLEDKVNRMQSQIKTIEERYLSRILGLERSVGLLRAQLAKIRQASSPIIPEEELKHLSIVGVGIRSPNKRPKSPLPKNRPPESKSEIATARLIRPETTEHAILARLETVEVLLA